MANYNFNNDQELRRYVMKEYGSDDWQAAYDFLKAGEATAKPTHAAAAPRESAPAEGIYIVYEDGHSELFNGNNRKDNVKCIGLNFGGHRFGVALRHINEVTLPSGRNGIKGRYFKGDIPALSDFDGYGNTATLIKRGDLSFYLQEGEWIPSLGELAAIYRVKDLLNKALEYVGGDLIPDDWHWSSTEYSPTSAWYLNFGNGVLYGNHKSLSNGVRAVCAF